MPTILNMQSRGTAALALVLALGLTPAAARAQDPEVHTDPDAGSPAGSVYQIPLEQGRNDAAPPGGVADGGANGGGGATGADGGANGGGGATGADGGAGAGGATGATGSALEGGVGGS